MCFSNGFIRNVVKDLVFKIPFMFISFLVFYILFIDFSFSFFNRRCPSGNTGILAVFLNITSAMILFHSLSYQEGNKCVHL